VSAAAQALLRRRLTAQGLTGPPATDAPSVARRLLAVQAQDARAARLAIRARTRGVSAADVDRALTEQRSIVITWLNRGTLQLVAADDYPWLQALTTPPLRTGSARRLSQEGVSPTQADRAVKVVRRALADEGPLAREALRERLTGAGIPVAGQALIHVLFRCTLEGLVVRGPMVGAQHAYVLVSDWLAPPAPVQREVALAELARRYLIGHGPAGERDLARWAGLPLRDARAGLSAIGSELRDEGDGMVDLRSRGHMGALQPPRLLGAFEPVLVGWCSRTFVLGQHDATVVTGGLFRGFALAQGRAVATWRLAGGEVKLDPFTRLDRSIASGLDDDAAEVKSFLTDPG
jgi:hypothetical protein